MKKQLATKLKSQTGASFSIALLLFIVCVVISSILIAAATVSAGQFANQGKSDQRYYAVTSAAQVFRDSLGGENGTREFKLEQMREGTQTITRQQNGDTSKGAITETQTSATFNPAAAVKGYDFLADITYYALFGVGKAKVDVASPADVLKAKDWGTWISPFTEGAWATAPTSTASGLKYLPDIMYDVTPTLNGDGAPSAADLKVKVRGRLRSDWTYELEFYNDAASESDRFYVYMALSADVAETDSTNEELAGSTTSGEGGSTVNTQTVTQKKTTTVTWRVERMVPGRGILGDA